VYVSSRCDEPHDVSAKSTSKPSKVSSDWKRIDALKDEDIDLSDHPEATVEMFARAVVRRGFEPVRRKQQVTLRIDADVLEWLRSTGKGWQTRVNTLLRAYMEAERSR